MILYKITTISKNYPKQLSLKFHLDIYSFIDFLKHTFSYLFSFLHFITILPNFFLCILFKFYLVTVNFQLTKNLTFIATLV